MALMALFLLLTEVFIAKYCSTVSWIRGSLGDVLVVALIYFSVQTILFIRPSILAVSVFAFAVGVECLQYFHIADALGLPPGHLARIIIGSTFSGWDILMYAAGCMLSWMVHRGMRLNPERRNRQVNPVT